MTLSKAMTAVMIMTFAIASSASATQTTISYNVAPGACSAPIAIPANNKPVGVMGTTITSGIPGEGQATLLRANNMEVVSWSGYDFYSSFSHGYAFGDGGHIIYLDLNGWVDVQTAPSTHIKVCNSSSNSAGRAIGYLTFTY